MNFKIVARKVLVSVAGLITISFPYYAYRYRAFSFGRIALYSENVLK